MRYQACLRIGRMQEKETAIDKQRSAIWASPAQSIALVSSAKAAHRQTALATPDAGVALALDPHPANAGRRGGVLCMSLPPSIHHPHP